MICDFQGGVFDDFIDFVSFPRYNSFFGTPIIADSLLENAEKILSPTLSKGEGDAIRMILVEFSDEILGE